MSEITRTLRTSDLRKASLLAAVLSYRLQKVFEMVRENEMSRADIVSTVRNCFGRLSAEVDENCFVPETNCPDLECGEQRVLALDYVDQLRTQIELRKFNGRMEFIARDALDGTKFDLDDQPIATRLDLLEGLARAMIEQQRLFKQT